MDEKQRWEESEKRRAEERRSEKRKSQRKEDAGARKGSKVATHCVFPMICGSGGSKSRLAKAAGGEPSGEMRDEKLHAVVAQSKFRSQKCNKLRSETTFGSWDVEKVHVFVARGHFKVNMCKTHELRTTNGSWDVEKVHVVVARSTFPSQNVKSTTCSDHFWRFRCGLAWQGQGILHLAKSEHYVKGFAAFPKTTMAGVWHLKRIWKDACRVAGAVQKTCSSEMLGGQGADFLETGCILHYQIFPFLNEDSQNCFGFDVVKFKNWGRLAELLRFGCCQEGCLTFVSFNVLMF